MNKEAAAIISAIAAFLTAVIGLAAAFGLNISDEQRNAVIGVVAPTAVVMGLIGPIIRQFVYSKNSVENLVDDAYTSTPGIDPKPKV